MQILCRAWLALDERESMREVRPNFDLWETPRARGEHLRELRARDQVAADSLVLLAEAIMPRATRPIWSI